MRRDISTFRYFGPTRKSQWNINPSGPIQKPLVLTFYGILNSEMSFWDRTGNAYAEDRALVLGNKNGTFFGTSRVSLVIVAQP